MTLDLIVRGAGSGRSPAAHLTALAEEYAGAVIILYGEAAGSPVPVVSQSAADSDALTSAIKAAGKQTVVVYGDESLLSPAQDMQPNLIWITLGPDANGVREIWRIRQQHPWLSQRKLGLLIEQLPDGVAPDTDRLVRLSRASQAVIVPLGVEPEPAVVETQAAAPEPRAEAVEPPAAAAKSPAEPEEAPAVAEPAPEPSLSEDEPAIIAPVSDPAAPVSNPDGPISTEEGAGAVMETNLSDKTEGATTNTQAEQALMQRYALVKERRATSARLTQAEVNVQTVLKELFVSRFSAGPEQAANFEALSRKLTEAAAELTQLSKAMANIETQLAKLAWLKDELEI